MVLLPSGRRSLVRSIVTYDVELTEAVTQLAMNEVGHVVLELAQPICYHAYARNTPTGALILIDRMTNNTVGAGMLVEIPVDLTDPLAVEETVKQIVGVLRKRRVIP